MEGIDNSGAKVSTQEQALRLVVRAQISPVLMKTLVKVIWLSNFKIWPLVSTAYATRFLLGSRKRKKPTEPLGVPVLYLQVAITKDQQRHAAQRPLS